MLSKGINTGFGRIIVFIGGGNFLIVELSIFSVVIVDLIELCQLSFDSVLSMGRIG